MYPRQIGDQTISAAERKLFDAIRVGLGNEWAVVHSLGLASHNRKPWAEIDFVLIGPTGVFCIEVKGGRVARQEGLWYFTDKNNHTAIKQQGPFEQVGSATAALTKNLQTKFSNLRLAAVGYGVAMPDIRFMIDGPDIESRVLYDSRDRERPFDAYVRRLGDYWHERLESQRGRAVQSLDLQDVARIVEHLRGDFDLCPSLYTRIGQAKEELFRLTDEQTRVLAGLVDNDRVLVRGGAGTGKTVLAMEEAQRRAAQGKRVLYCCFNRRLAAFLRETADNSSLISIHHLHGLMRELIEAAGLRDQLPRAEDADLFEIFYPEAALDALLQLDRLEEFDVLIVDEGQDLLRESYVQVLEALVKGGLNKGTWRWFLDPYQDIYHGLAAGGIQRVMAGMPAQFRLSTNCRNTLPVATATSLLSGVDCRTTLVADGPEVQEYWYRDRAHQRREISNCLKRMLSEGMRPQDIIVLSRRRLENSVLRDGLLGVAYPIIEAEKVEMGVEAKAIRFSTISSFKGLESDAVLVVDIEDLSSSDALLSVYVGASRARAFLAVFLAEAVGDDHSRLAFEFGQRLATDN